ncbi:MAG TPA: methyltransferase domain-containing protein [Acidimicrobiales bacterium]|nr:methyltransferase domain-containing protein [Acidimicrobiales bacterium]
MDDTEAVLRHYGAYREEQRLTAGLGQLELVRTQEILRRHLPPPPARLLDVGGGTGVHASWLARDGYLVHVVDLTPRHVDMVRGDLSTLGVTADIGDARHLDHPDGSFDAVLVLGPLYHLTERADRLRALREAVRVVGPGGPVAVAAINRFASLFDGLARGFLLDPEFRRIVDQDLADGRHRNPHDRPHWFTTAYFHHPLELRRELENVGLSVVELVGVEGLAGWLAHLADAWDTDAGREAILHASRVVESEPTLLGLSAHLLAVTTAPV